MNYFDVLQYLVYQSGYKINTIEDLDHLQQKLEENFEREKSMVEKDELNNRVLQIIEEDAVCPTFQEDIIRKSLSLGYYPMSLEKIIMMKDEYEQYKDLISNVIPLKKGFYVWRYYMTIRHHLKKMIIDFDRFTFPKKTHRYVRQTFADYTLTFNRDFDLCAERLIARYKEQGTWLVPPLLEVFRKIHENPDSNVSVDSVELWHGDELVAGELGFITHNAYASLCGFHTENNSGTIQMAALGTLLKELGFAYWDLGMEMEYKYVYGALCMGRAAQKEYYNKLSNTRLALPKREFKIGEVIR